MTKQVPYSSKKCAEFNKENKSLIEHGLELEWVPTPEILQREKEEEERQKKEAKTKEEFNQKSTEFWQKIINLLPQDYQKYVKVSGATITYADNYYFFSIRGSVETYYPQSYWSDKKYLRVLIGDYGNKKFWKSTTQNIYTLPTEEKLIKNAAKEIEERIEIELNNIKYRKEKEEKAKISQQIFTENAEMFNYLRIWGYTDLNLDNNKISSKINFTGTLEDWKALAEFIKERKEKKNE